jgi:hypothetical protein
MQKHLREPHELHGLGEGLGGVVGDHNEVAGTLPPVGGPRGRHLLG